MYYGKLISGAWPFSACKNLTVSDNRNFGDLFPMLPLCHQTYVHQMLRWYQEILKWTITFPISRCAQAAGFVCFKWLQADLLILGSHMTEYFPIPKADARRTALLSRGLTWKSAWQPLPRRWSRPAKKCAKQGGWVGHWIGYREVLREILKF